MIALPIAFLMGFFGSVHCAVMCGPIVLGLPLNQNRGWHSFLQVLLYQLGRAFAYTLLGAIIGYVGSSVLFFTSQEALTIAIGVVLVAFSMLQLSGKYLVSLQQLQTKVLNPISKLMGKVFKLPLWGFFAGFLNGLIPCGMVYLALATALNLANVFAASKFMLLFGLGTTPLMLCISIGGVYLKKYVRFNSQKLIPWFMLGIGLLFILRSLNLDIPFLSPLIHAVYGKVSSCG